MTDLGHRKIIQSDTAGVSPRYLVIVAIFVTCLIVSNIIAVKLVSIHGVVLTAATFIFPISYIFGDVLTEVYGYRLARRAIWLGFLCNVLAVGAFWLGQSLPAAPFWKGQGAYEAILGYTPRLVVASFIAYLIGEFANSFILAKMKVATKGRWLWTRTIGSTIVGEGLDSLVFITLAFFGGPPTAVIGLMILTQWFTKTAIEVIATPFTYLVVGYLKRVEGIDVYDRETRFNPLLVTE